MQQTHAKPDIFEQIFSTMSESDEPPTKRARLEPEAQPEITNADRIERLLGEPNEARVGVTEYIDATVKPFSAIIKHRSAASLSSCSLGLSSLF